MRTRRFSYAAGTVLMAAIILVPMSDSANLGTTVGISTGRVTSTAEGYRLEVRYPAVTRPALATPFDIRIESADGFNWPIQVALSWDWLEMWDENSWYPTPSSAYGNDDKFVMEFDPPPGNALRVIYDARIQPAQQSGRSGYVALLDNDQEITRVSFRTRVMP